MKEPKLSQRPFAVFDIDGTLIRWQLYHAIADALAKKGLIDTQTYRTIRDARMLWKRRAHDESFKDYEKRLVQGYEALLTKLSVEQFEAAATEVFEEYKDQVYTYTRELIRDLKAKGYLLFAISGSQIEIVGKIAGHYGFDDFVGSLYERKNGGFTGRVSAQRFGKHLILQEFIEKHQAALRGSIAVGDSEGDISMMEVVERPIAFNPEKKLLAHAQKAGWDVVLERKNVVYELRAQDDKYILVQTKS